MDFRFVQKLVGAGSIVPTLRKVREEGGTHLLRFP